MIEYALGEQLVAGAQRMDEDNIMRGLADGIVQLDVAIDLGLEVVALEGGSERIADRRKALPVVRRRPRGRHGGGEALEFPAVFEIIPRRALVSRHQFRHGLGKDLADEIGDEGSAAMPAFDQSPAFEFLQRVAQHRTRDRQLVGELTFGGQPVAAGQHAVEQQELDLPHRLVGRAAMIDLSE